MLHRLPKSVRPSSTRQALRSINLDPKDITLIKNLYYNQTAVVRIDDNETNQVEIQRGVRQGCVLSPQLFNVYSQLIFQKALWERTEGVNIGGTIINNIRFPDDTAIMAESSEDLQILLDSINRESKKMGLTMNIGKTKYMVISKTPIDNIQLTLLIIAPAFGHLITMSMCGPLRGFNTGF